MIHELIYKLGIAKRNPNLIPYLQFLRKSDEWTIEKLEEYQFKKCKELCIFAEKHSPFYKKHFAKSGFNPDKMQDLNDLKSIPITKDILRNNVDAIHTHYKFNQLRLAETSGTSGQPLSFYRNEEWDSHNRAAMFRGYSWYGVDPWERNGYFWGYNIDKSQYYKTLLLDTLQNRFRLFSYDKEHIQSFIVKLTNASFLTGYSSMIYEVAKMVNELNIAESFNLKMIKGTSEKIYDSYQPEVIKAFGKKMISEYGACESGLIAFECPECGNMHINMENVVVEEENGEIIVTNLLSRSFPIIRYKLGDSIKLAPKGYRCPCGREHSVILDVLGRVGKNIIGKTKKYPSLTFYYVFKNLTLNHGIILNYQAVQNEPGIIMLRIEQNNIEYLNALNNELQKYFSDDIDFIIKWGETLHVMDGKLKDFITNIN